MPDTLDSLMDAAVSFSFLKTTMILPGYFAAASFMRSARLMISRMASSKLSIPLQNRAVYSPTLCPMKQSGLNPLVWSRSNRAAEERNTAGWVFSVRLRRLSSLNMILSSEYPRCSMKISSPRSMVFLISGSLSNSSFIMPGRWAP